MSKADIHGQIVVSENPRGRFREGMLKAATTALPGQNLKHEATDVFSPGFAGELNIVVAQTLIGGTITDAYAAAARCYSYAPLPGDEFLALGLSGQTLNIGTRATFNAAGKVIAAATGELIVEEAAGELDADALVLVRLGHSNTATAS